ncbi:MAG: zinc ribbon domain-containing protein [Anaerolineae bacterium]|jgi:putative FmdB family regulatory protein|nr:zinc ribbon domain-containing protein [Anaerolineae bacterium]
MPIFEYVCSKCGHKFEKLILSASKAREVRCPQCESGLVEKSFSTFGVGSGGSTVSASAANCAPSG